MSTVGQRLKRSIKTVVRGSGPIVKVEVCQKTPDDSLKGRTFIITGGGSGLGLAIAKALANCHATTIITGRDEDKLKEAAKIIGAECFYESCDLRDVDNVKALIRSCFQKHGHIDGLINNAGVSLHEWDFLKVTEEGFDMQLETNLRGGYFASQEYVKEVLESHKAGHILFISSESGTMCDDLPYGLTKRAINSLVEALSFKYYKQGIRVNAIAPGVTATDMTNINPQSNLYSDNTSGRIFIPEEVAEVATFLLSDNSKCISGQIIHTNGGNHIKRRY